MTIISKHTKVKTLFRSMNQLSASGLAMHMIYYQFFCIFWTELGQITLTFRVGISRSLKLP